MSSLSLTLTVLNWSKKELSTSPLLFSYAHLGYHLGYLTQWADVVLYEHARGLFRQQIDLFWIPWSLKYKAIWNDVQDVSNTKSSLLGPSYN